MRAAGVCHAVGIQTPAPRFKGGQRKDFTLSLVSKLRQFPICRTLLDEFPVAAKFPDGQRRVVPRRLGRTIGIWDSIAECRLESEAVLRTYSGGDFIDVGAFHGWYSVLLANKMRSSDRALSMEPDATAQPHLLATLAAVGRLFPGVQLVALPFAAGDGTLTQVSYPHGQGSHPSFNSATDSGMLSRTRSITIDSVVEAFQLEPSFVKIDVEGAESFVLDGMRRTLAMFRPKMMIEFHPLWQPSGYTHEQMEQQLAGLAYKCDVLAASAIAVRELWLPS
jgi:FkbM family methyltransferase